MTDGQTLQDSTQIGAQESTTHGPKWSLVPGLREGMGSETFMVVEFSRDGGNGSTTR